jgi:hypothetical protein
LTKGEFIKLLEPFDDDIRIVVEDRDREGIHLTDPTAHYEVAKDFSMEFAARIDKGEGYIRLA